MNWLETLPTTKEELAQGTPNPEFIISLNKRMNEQAERIKALFGEIESNTETANPAEADEDEESDQEAA